MNQRFYRNCTICQTYDYVCSVPIKIYFTPNSEKEVNFNLVCEVKRKTLPLTLNVKAEGYSMNCLVLCEDLSGNKVELTSSGLNAINFGEVNTWPRFIHTNGLFTLPDLDSVSDSSSDSKPDGYITLYRTFHIAQSKIQIPILTTNYRNWIRIRVCLLQYNSAMMGCGYILMVHSHSAGDRDKE